MQKTPRVAILGGCNGAGKTTVARALLAETLGLLTFVDADQIAQGLSGFAPEHVTIAASRIMLERLREVASCRESFGFETTLSGLSYATFLRELRQADYRVEIFYFWLADVELSIQRVAARVAAGGHAIPEATLHRRYLRSVRNFLTVYRHLADAWEVYDNSQKGKPVLIANGRGARVSAIGAADRWTAFEKGSQTMPDEAKQSPMEQEEVARHEAAVQRAVHDAVRLHALMGRPVVGWQNGQIVWSSPAEVLRELGNGAANQSAEEAGK